MATELKYPVAENPESPEIQGRQEEFVRYMQAQGLLVEFPAPDQPPPTGFEPLVIPGKPLSKTIIEDRD